MQCKDFKCVYELDGECDQIGGECIGDICDNYGECSSCQKQDQSDCDM